MGLLGHLGQVPSRVMKAQLGAVQWGNRVVVGSILILGAITVVYKHKKPLTSVFREHMIILWLFVILGFFCSLIAPI